MSQRNLKPWMRYELAVVWIATVAVLLIAVAAIVYRVVA
jgi:hypothetical protein